MFIVVDHEDQLRDIPKLRALCTEFWQCNYLSMLGLKLIHVSKRGYRYIFQVQPNGITGDMGQVKLQPLISSLLF